MHDRAALSARRTPPLCLRVSRRTARTGLPILLAHSFPLNFTDMIVDVPKVMLMLTSVFSTILVNSSKLIFPSRSRSASIIVLSTICCSC